MRTEAQTFPPRDGTGTLTFPAREKPYRVQSLCFRVINDALGPPGVTPVVEVTRAGVCTTYSLPGQGVPPGLAYTHTFAPHLNNQQIGLNAAQEVITRGLPELIIEETDRLSLRIAEGDATTTVDVITLLTGPV